MTQPRGYTPNIIPRALLFGNPDKARLTISPDGALLAYLAPLDGVQNIWCAPAGRLEEAQPVTRVRQRGVVEYAWAHLAGCILYVTDDDGSENARASAVDVSTGESVELSPRDGVSARFVHVSARRPGEVVISMNLRGPYLRDLYRVDLRTGRRTLLLEADPTLLCRVLDDDYAVRLALRAGDDGALVLLAVREGRLGEVCRFAAEDRMQSRLCGFDERTNSIYVIDSSQRDTAALFWISLTTGERRLLAEHDRADADDVMIHPTTRVVEAVSFDPLQRSWTFLDPRVEAHFERLRAAGPGSYCVVSRTADDTRWVVRRAVDAGSARYCLYDTLSGESEPAFLERPALEGLEFSKQHALELAASDGLRLPSFLTLPHESDREGAGTPRAPLPLVLWVHGGPWLRDSWGFNPTHQWLANRGYAVLSVNFRGSTGFGKSFTNAGDGEWGGRMQEDLLDAIQWAIDAGVADETRIAIAGISYGGYATLVGLTSTPNRFACGVEMAGPSNLLTMLAHLQREWSPIAPVLQRRMGDTQSPEGRSELLARSPLANAKAIRKPLLIAQGANDPRVERQESDAVAAAALANGTPLVYALYPDEGHILLRAENHLSFLALTEMFLSEYLGGRAEPMGADTAGSSLQLLAGEKIVSRLQARLGGLPCSSCDRIPPRYGISAGHDISAGQDDMGASLPAGSVNGR